MNVTGDCTTVFTGLASLISNRISGSGTISVFGLHLNVNSNKM